MSSIHFTACTSLPVPRTLGSAGRQNSLLFRRVKNREYRWSAADTSSSSSAIRLVAILSSQVEHMPRRGIRARSDDLSDLSSIEEEEEDVEEVGGEGVPWRNCDAPRTGTEYSTTVSATLMVPADLSGDDAIE